MAKCVRMTAGVVYTQRIRHYGVVETPDHWKEKVRSFCRDLGIYKPVELLESGIVRMPMVIGHLKPVIFIPLGLLMRLPENEIEAVILHELAHIRRHDYFVNFLQHVAENLFFFNPGLLWISSLLREERENCCDDIAIGRTNDKIAFVRALVSFKEHALRQRGVALNFPSGKHQLLQRVLRITHNKTKTLNPGEKLFFFGSCLVGFVILSSIYSAGLTAGGHLYAKEGEQLKVSEPAGYGVVSLKRLAHEQVWLERNPRPLETEPTEPVVAKVRTPKHAPALHSSGGNGQVYRADIVHIRKETARSTDDIADNITEAAKNKLLAKQDRDQPEGDKLQAGLDILQAQRDKQQAERDMMQAKLDQVQAQRDHEQARLDQVQALRDQVQAMRDKEQAVKDRQQADREKKL
jgi:bla regulator protein BlaR1